MDENKLKNQLNADHVNERLDAVSKLRELIDAGKIPAPERTGDTNNHVHTTYSFSPYSPSAAVYHAYMAGLSTVGIIDHDSVSGTREFIEAGKRMGITTTIGCEVRASYANTQVAGRMINNPDETSVGYMTLHGLPHNRIDDMDRFLFGIREKRNERNARQVAKLNDILAPFGLRLDFIQDVLPVSKAAEGGSVTERHILFALSHKIIEKYGKGAPILDFLQNDLHMQIGGPAAERLLDTAFYAYDYDLLNILKAQLVPRFYISGGEDILPIRDVIDFARTLNVIPAYTYLGDIAESPTGDKKTEHFEDSYLDELFALASELKFEAIAYMPSRNTREQLRRVMDKCTQYGFLEISGEDINQPRQSFLCKQLREPEFAHLVTNTWALVGHEHAAEQNPNDSFYSEQSKQTWPDLRDRIEHFAEQGRQYSRP
ncbi:MAG: PHP domain-containing protein [Clostridiales Family XIII bacterium]|jgi:hypothetical protein|nr:PHP domain-containing protein [Clostridiales Family XIII bacterium]